MWLREKNINTGIIAHTTEEEDAEEDAVVGDSRKKLSRQYIFVNTSSFVHLFTFSISTITIDRLSTGEMIPQEKKPCVSFAYSRLTLFQNPHKACLS